MIDRPIELSINGQRLECKVTVWHDRLKLVTCIDADLPHLAMYHEFIKELNAAPSLDRVMATWHKEAA